jgi:hypothetical protein
MPLLASLSDNPSQGIHRGSFHSVCSV